MSPAQAWRKLGLEPGSDRRAIRRAYADKLRALDVDADPDGFATLRDARDIALRLAERQTETPPASFEEAATDEPSPSPAAGLTAPTLGLDASSNDRLTVRVEEAPSDYVRAVPDIGPSGKPDSEAIADPGAPFAAPLLERTVEGAVLAHAEESARAAHAAMDAHYAAIHELLLPEDVEEPGALDDREKVQLQAHVSTVLTDPRLAEIAFYADAEAWFARVLAHSSPRSDPVLARIVEFFGWMKDAGKIGQKPEVAFLTRRRASLDFCDAVRQPKHRLHSAWVELTRPTTERTIRTPGVSRKKVLELLNLVRRQYPDLEQAFDWYRVELWQKEGVAGTGIHWRTMWIALVLGIQVLLAVSRCQPETKREPLVSLPQILPRDQASELNQALDAATDGTVDWNAVLKRNPTLAQMLKSDFEASKLAGEKSYLFVDRTARKLTERAAAARRIAPYALAAEHQRIILDRARELNSRDPKLCADFLGPSTQIHDEWPEALRKRVATMQGELLLTVNPTRPAPTGLYRYRIPGDVVLAAANRAHLTRERFSAALHDDASPAERCLSRMALLEESLATQSSEHLRLLREM